MSSTNYDVTYSMFVKKVKLLLTTNANFFYNRFVMFCEAGNSLLNVYLTCLLFIYLLSLVYIF